jgi:tripartite-type tricarboxylate transporter receptor subunit TctC
MGRRHQERQRQTVKPYLKLLGLCVAGALYITCAWAQPYPAKPIRMLVGAAPGGTTDIVARIVAAKLGERLNQQVLVENRGGAGGNLALDVVAKAPPDGYTLGMAYSGLSINPVVMSNMPFDTLNDLAPVSLVSTVQMFLIVDAATKIHSVQSLIEQARTNPGKFSIAANALASVSHLSAELFKMRAGVDMPTVVYKGSSPALIDIVGGRVTAMFDTVPGALAFIKSGKIRAIGIGGNKRSSVMPDVPTLQEAGLKDFEIRSWYGVVAAAKTPPDIVDRLSTEIAAVVKTEDIRTRFAAQSLDPVGSTPAAFGAFIRAEMASWESVAKNANIKID